MMIRICLFLLDMFLLNIAFLLSFLVRYAGNIPEHSFFPYKDNFLFLTLLYTSALSFFGVYKRRFKSSWDLFRRVFLGLWFGTLLSIAFIYVFRTKWGAFPTSVIVITFFISLFSIFKLNREVLKAKKRINKRIVIIGQGNVDETVTAKADVERISVEQVPELAGYADIDEIVISQEIQDGRNLSLLTYLAQKLKIDVVFDPSIYIGLLSGRINGENSVALLGTFVGKRRDIDEFLIRSLDIIGSALVLLICLPVLFLISLLVKVSSSGPVLYKQKRVGKDGKLFTLYKFRTMIKDSEKLSGLSPASENDPRVTRVGKWLRQTRLDELLQLLNVVKGEMSLVGPRPENLYRVEIHESLQGLRLAVKPGITGLAQIRSLYDLNPKHKIKYDYLYIQRRSLLLNLYILAKTIPVVLSKTGL